MFSPDMMMTPAEIAIAKERGRLKAYEVLLVNPAKRAQMEKKWGLERMKQRWPELYVDAPPPAALLLIQFQQQTFGVGAFARA